MENCEKRSMKACAACAEIFTCEKSPYRAEAGQVLEEDWRGYNRIRAMMCTMPAERYADFRELAMTDEQKQMMEESGLIYVPEDVRKHFDHLLIEEGIIGLERVHRMLLKMVEDGTVRVIPSKKTEQKCSQCSDGTQASHDIHCSHLQKRAVPDRFSHSDNMSAGLRNDGQDMQDNQP